MLQITITSESTPEELRITAEVLLRLAARPAPEYSVPSTQLPLPLPAAYAPDAPTAIRAPTAAAAPLVVDPVALLGASSTPEVPAPAAAPVAPAAAAPAPTPTPAPVVTTLPPNALLDSEGLPWDARIHSEGKAQNASDGKWRKRRGIPDDLVAAVTAELKALMGVSAATPVTTSVAAPIAAPIAAAEEPALDPVAAFAPPASPAVPTPPPPAPVFVPPAPIPTDATDGPTTFNDFMSRVMAAMGQQRINQAQIQAACASQGVPSLAALTAAQAQDPTTVPRVWAEVQKVMAQ